MIRCPFVLSLMVFGVGGISVVCSTKSIDPPTAVAESECIKPKLNYLVVTNEKRSANLRHVQVFLDKRDFSEPNLRALFEYLSEKFPSPKYLTISVYTDWAQIDPPTDCPVAGSSGGGEKLDKHKFLWAVFNRHEENVVFKYKPELESDQMETVVLKQ